MNNGLQSLAKYGRNGDTQLTHLMVGEVVLPPNIFFNDNKLKKSIQKKLNKLDTNLTERTVGSNLVSYNPYTGFAEFGFFSNLWKKVKKVIDPVTKVAQFIPGPWQAPSAIYQKGKAAVDIVKGKGDLSDILQITGGPKLFGEKGVARDFLENFGEKGFRFPEYGDAFRSAAGNIGEFILPGADEKGLFKNLMERNPVFPSQQTYVGPDGSGGTTTISQEQYEALAPEVQATYNLSASPESSGSFFGYRTPDFIRNIEKEFKDTFDPDKGGIDPKLFAASLAYGKAIKSKAEREAEGLKDIRQSKRPDLAQQPVFGLGGFDLGFAAGGSVYSEDEVLDMRAGGESAGPGTGTSDDIPAMLSDGEFVMTAKAVRGAGTVNVKKGKDGLLSFVKSGKPSRGKGSDNMMVMMKYFEGVA